MRVDGELLEEGEVLTDREAENEGFAFASDGDISVEIDPELDDELRLEGRVLDLIHAVNTMRKEQGLELTDRIVLTLPESDRDLLPFEGQIKAETLATQVRVGDSLKIKKAWTGRATRRFAPDRARAPHVSFVTSSAPAEIESRRSGDRLGRRGTGLQALSQRRRSAA